MESGLNNHLKRISSELFIKEGSPERKKIEISIEAILDYLEEYFEDEIDETIVFGSYSRDTILPRRFDPHSDIDILVQFNTKDYEKLKPDSYRGQLKRFSEECYPRSTVVKDHPSIVLELNHIKFDLVPSIFDKGLFYDSLEIPNKNGSWMETEPEEFNEKLTHANTKYNSIVKPIIRLMKYWNASHEYPFYSYELETALADMNFNDDNYESGFFYAAKQLSASRLPFWASTKLDMLKINIDRLKECLRRNELIKAKEVLNRVLPGFI